MKSAILVLLPTLLVLGDWRVQAADDSGFYSVWRDDSGAWWFRNAKGELFLSLGVSDIPAGPSREQYDPANPGYAAFRYYNSTDDWVQSVRKNLRQWGFNTIGAWGHPQLATEDLPECRVLHWGSALGVPWCDMFSEDFSREIEKFALRDIERWKNEKNLLGWFTDNELQWYSDTLFHYHLHNTAPSITRRRLLDMLQELYKGDFDALKADFNPAGARVFDELGRRGPVYMKPGANGAVAISRFAFLLAERYYGVVHNAIRRRDPNHLILGDRYMSYCPPEVARAAGPYVDVISTNFDWPDWKTGQLPTHYLRMLHELSGRPVLVTEWYVAAEENRSGNRNRGESFTKVKTQEQRAATAEQRLLTLVGEPYVVGAHWFRYADEPTNGRAADGEDFNFGLVDIHDKSYERLVECMTRANHRAADQHASSAVQKVPRILPINRLSTVKFPQDVEKFTRVPARDSAPLAELRVAWKDDRLYLGVVGFSFSDQRLFKDGKIHSSLHQELSFAIGENGFNVSFDPNSDSAVQPVSLEMVESQNRHYGVRFTYLVTVPAKKLTGIEEFRPGSSVSLRATLRNPRRGATSWRQELILGDDAEALAETPVTTSLER